ncbi:hypothetical protein [Primorskyibacter sp. 2E233]|uniref:hypothetical protein n=1 Tax=Primorskyibacter sp. 2E233 TaxID=3413431 RepID=UPI003BF118E3
MTFDRRLVILSALSTLALPQVALSDDAPIKLRELYNKDKSLSDLALSREGARTTFEGFMAPPLKADAGFFVLTKQPMATCPFCESSVDWPDSILPVYTKRVVDVVPFNVKITARGVLMIEDYVDPDTGFFSKLRLVDATYDH